MFKNYFRSDNGKFGVFINLKSTPLCLFLLFTFSSCSFWERKEIEYAYQEISESEILVDFTKINPGSWDTLLFVPPYSTSDQIGLGYSDSEFLAFQSGADFYIVAGFIEKGYLKGYTLATRETDFDLLFNNSDSLFVKKIPRSEAVFRFIKQEDGTYSLVN
jgi:hypothetical protein